LGITITNNLKRPEPQALAAAVAALAARFGNRLVTLAGGARPARPYHHLAGAAAARRGGHGAGDRRYPGRGADLRALRRSRDRIRYRHLAGGPGQRARRGRLHRFARHEQGARSARRRPRLRDPARRHPQGAERAFARPGRVLSRSTPAPMPRWAAWHRPGRPAPMRCATAPCATTCWRSRWCAATARSSPRARGRKKSSAGYDLTHLFVGAEGTLGIICELTIKLRGIPETIAAAACSFDSVRGACQATILAIQTGIPRCADRTAQCRAGSGLQCLFETVAAGNAAAAAGVSWQRERGRRAIEEFQRDRQRVRRRGFHLDPPGPRIAPNSGRRGTTPIGRSRPCVPAPAWWRPTSACRSPGWPSASPKPKRI